MLARSRCSFPTLAEAYLHGSITVMALTLVASDGKTYEGTYFQLLAMGRLWDSVVPRDSSKSVLLRPGQGNRRDPSTWKLLGYGYPWRPHIQGNEIDSSTHELPKLAASPDLRAETSNTSDANEKSLICDPISTVPGLE